MEASIYFQLIDEYKLIVVFAVNLGSQTLRLQRVATRDI